MPQPTANLQKSGTLIGEILNSDQAHFDASETTIELNFALLKIKHTIKKEGKNELSHYEIIDGQQLDQANVTPQTFQHHLNYDLPKSLLCFPFTSLCLLSRGRCFVLVVPGVAAAVDVVLWSGMDGLLVLKTRGNVVGQKKVKHERIRLDICYCFFCVGFLL